ncbi:ribonuclease HII [[Eubacterium] cellulosolvens]
MGPLIVAGILMNKKNIVKLEELKVKDSKLIRPKIRERLDGRIKKVVNSFQYSILSVDTIDYSVEKGDKLNSLEIETMARLINRLKPDEAYIDAVGPVEKIFTIRISKLIDPEIKIIAEHKADRKYLVVSAASILAKVKRDRIINNLRHVYGDFGSGYPSDLRTRDFLIQWIKKFDEAPKFARKSWKTVKNLEHSE